MGKITQIYKTGVYSSGVEIELDNMEKITIGNSSSGIKVYEKILIFPKLIWRCDNISMIEKMFPLLKEDFIGDPLERIAEDIINRFKSKQGLISFLTSFRV